MQDQYNKEINFTSTQSPAAMYKAKYMFFSETEIYFYPHAVIGDLHGGQMIAFLDSIESFVEPDGTKWKTLKYEQRELPISNSPPTYLAFNIKKS